MKKYTCPECGKSFLNRKPKSCPQCGCKSDSFVETELVEMPVQQAQPQYVAQQSAPVAQQPASVEISLSDVSLNGFMNFLSVIVLLAGIAGGMYVLIKGCVEASEASDYYHHVSAGPAVISGLLIILLSMVQFGMIRLFVRMRQTLDNINAKMK